MAVITPLSPCLDIFLQDVSQSADFRNSVSHGDWYEFGLLTGSTTGDTVRRLHQAGVAPRHLFGFDSFIGLPSGDKKFRAHQFSSIDALHKQNITGSEQVTINDAIEYVRSRIDFNRTTIVPGFFSTSLTKELVFAHQMRPAVWVNIDVDLYVSAYQALDWLFANRLVRPGTFLYYDDLYYYPLNSGEDQAHREISQKYNLVWRPRLTLSRPQPGQSFPWNTSKFQFRHSRDYRHTVDWAFFARGRDGGVEKTILYQLEAIGTQRN